MYNLTFKHLVLGIFVFSAISCTRSAKQTSSIKLQLPNQISVKKGLKTQSLPTNDGTMMLGHAVVNISGPGMPLQLSTWDSCHDCQTQPPPPSYFEMIVPRGDSRLVQVLLVYMSQDNQMYFYYGDATANVQADIVSVDVAMTQLGTGTEMISGAIAGRYISTLGADSTLDQGPTGPVNIKYNPGNGKPSMIIEKGNIINGWFNFFALSNVPFDYVMDNGTVLFANTNLNSFTPNQRTAIAYLPQHFECWTDMGNVMCSDSGPREKEIVVLGYFGATGVDLSAKSACSSYIATAIDKWKKYDSADLDGPENNADVGSTKILYTVGLTTMSFDNNNARAYVNSNYCSGNSEYFDVLKLKDENLSRGRHLASGFMGPNISIAGQPVEFNFNQNTKQMMINLSLLPGLVNSHITSYDVYFGDMTAYNMHDDSIPCQELANGKIGGWTKGADSILPISNSSNFTVTTSVPQNHNKVAICAKKGTVTLNYGFSQEFFNGNSNCTNCNNNNSNGLIANLQYYNIPVNTCVTLNVQLPVVNGVQVNADGVTVLTLESLNFSSNFYDSANCSGNSVSQIVLPSGSATRSLSLMPTTTGSGSISIEYGTEYFIELNGININNGGSSTQPVDHLAIIHDSDTSGITSANQCVNLKIAAKGTNNNNISSSEAINFYITASTNNNFYYSYDDCQNQTNSVAMPQVLSMYDMSTELYYHVPSNAANNSVISFSLSNVTRPDSSIISGNLGTSLTVADGNSFFASLSLSHAVVSGLCYLGQVGVQKLNHSNFTETFTAQFNTVSGLSLYSDANCTTNYSPSTISQTVPANFYYKYIKQGTENSFSITTAINGINYQNSRNIMIDASNNTTITSLQFWRSQMQPYDLNQCYNLEVSIQNMYGTPVPANASTNFNLSLSNNFTADFYSSNDCSGSTNTTIQIPQGASRYRFSFKPTSTASYASITGVINGASSTITGIYVQTPPPPQTYILSDQTQADFDSGTFNNVIWDNSSSLLRIDRSAQVNDKIHNSSWTPQFNNLVAYWPMDNNINDESGNGNNLSPYYEASLTKYHSKVGVGNMNLTMPNSYLTVNSSSSLDLVSGMTISAWVLMPPTTTDVWLFGKNGDGFTTGYGIAIKGNSGKIWPHLGLGNVLYNPLSNSSIIFNQWNHIVVTYDGSFVKIYINGVLDSNFSYSGAIATNTNPLFIASNPISPSQKLVGKIDDFAIWNSALTSSEVTTIFTRQNQFIQYIGNFESHIFNGAGPRTWNSIEWMTRLPSLKELPGDTNNDGVIDGSDNENFYNYPNITSNLMDGLVRLWHFNETSFDTSGGNGDFKDFSGKGQWLDSSGAMSIGVNGQFLSGIRLFGAESAIGSDSFLPFNNGARTVGLWVNFASLPPVNSSMTLFSYGTQSSGQAYGLSIENNNGEFRLRNFGWNDDFTVPVYLDINKWNHFAVTYDSGYARIFHNGYEIGMTNKSWNTISSGNFYLGKNLDGTNFSNARFDEVAIWNRSLSGPEVIQIYRRGADRVLIQVRSCTDSTCSSGTTAWMGPDGTGGSFFNELRNRMNNTFVDQIFSELPYMQFSNFGLIPTNYFDNKQYFQYKVIMESDDTNYLCNYGSGPHACVPEYLRTTIEYQ